MNVQELIDLLEAQDPNAEVLIMTQQNWPFENAVYGVTVRSELTGDDEGGARPEDGAPNDVFIVEGGQLRYGSKAAWEVAAR